MKNFSRRALSNLCSFFCLPKKTNQKKGTTAENRHSPLLPPSNRTILMPIHASRGQPAAQFPYYRYSQLLFLMNFIWSCERGILFMPHNGACIMRGAFKCGSLSHETNDKIMRNSLTYKPNRTMQYTLCYEAWISIRRVHNFLFLILYYHESKYSCWCRA
jgi:hypothetical protein